VSGVAKTAKGALVCYCVGVKHMSPDLIMDSIFTKLLRHVCSVSDAAFSGSPTADKNQVRATGIQCECATRSTNSNQKE